jgi:hypothetical protein
MRVCENRVCGLQVYPGLTSWVILSVPVRQAQGRLCGTGLAGNVHPALRAGLFSAVPSGLVPIEKANMEHRQMDSGVFRTEGVTINQRKKRRIRRKNVHSASALIERVACRCSMRPHWALITLIIAACGVPRPRTDKLAIASSRGAAAPFF